MSTSFGTGLACGARAGCQSLQLTTATLVVGLGCLFQTCLPPLR